MASLRTETALQMIRVPSLALNVILLEAERVKLRFAVLCAALFFILRMHVESMRRDASLGPVITLGGKDVGGKCVQGRGLILFCGNAETPGGPTAN